MNNKIWRLLFTILLIGMGVGTGWLASDAVFGWLLKGGYISASMRPIYWGVFLPSGCIFGFGLGLFVFRRIESIGDQMRKMSVRDKIAIVAGLTLGVFLTAAVSFPIFQVIPSKLVAIAVVLLTGVVLTYLATAAAFSMKEEIHFYMPPPREEEEALPQEMLKILDTNVIIDGRVADIARAGFIEGTMYVPGFVLQELQYIADSADGLKRARGRRGLDILNQMQKDLTLMVRTYDRLVPDDKEDVDARLVKLAKALNSSLITNDFNLNKVAELQGVPVLNINELANALKPVVLPGEEMRVAVVREGREQTQGIGYLDDGTMIVIEGGRRYIGETMDVVVSSLLQTTAGKMIFAHVKDEEGPNDFDRSVRAYTRGARSTTRSPRA